MWRWSNAAIEQEIGRQQHAVAEHVPGHVADPHHRQVVTVGVDAEHPGVTANALPRTAGRDAHLLVVVALAAAGGERVAEPEVVLRGDLVGDVAEGRRALVGGHHQIGIVVVVYHRVRRMNDGSTHHVVRHVEQAAHETLVPVDALGAHRVTIRRIGVGALHHEAALRSGRHDHRVLDHLGLHQAQHLGAEVLEPFAPAQATTRNGPTAQVDTLDERRADEDLELRARFGEERDVAGTELHRDLVTKVERIGSHGGLDEGEERPADPVVVERRYGVELFEQRAADVIGELETAGGVEHQRRIETGVEQLDEQAGDGRLPDEGLLDVLPAEPEADLAEITAIETQHGDLTRVEPALEDEPVEPVGLDRACDQTDERPLHLGLPRLVDVVLVDPHTDLVDRHGGARLVGPAVTVGVTDGEDGRVFLHRLQTQLAEDRHERSERRSRTAEVDAEPPVATLAALGICRRRAGERGGDARRGRRRIGEVGRADGHRAVVVRQRDHGRHLAEVHHRICRDRAGAVFGRGGPTHQVEDPFALDRAHRARQRSSGLLLPGLRREVDGGAEFVEIDQFGGPHRHRDPRQRTGTEHRFQVAHFPAVLVRDEARHTIRQQRVEPRRRDVHQHGRQRAHRFGDVEDPHDAPFLEPDDVDDELGESVGVELEDQVSWQRLHDVADGPAGVAHDVEPRQAEHFGRPLAQHRNGEHALPVGRARQ